MNTDRAFKGFNLQNASSAFMIKIVGGGLLFLCHILFARLLGKEEYGIYIYVIAWINILLLVGRMGFDIASIRFVSSYVAKEMWGYLSGFLQFSSRFVFTSSISVAALVYGLVTFIGWENGLGYAVGVGCLLLPLLSSCQLCDGVLKGFKKVKIALALQQVFLPLTLILSLFISVKIIGIEATGVNGLWVHITGALLTLLTYFYFVYGVVPEEVKGKEKEFESALWLKTGAALILTSSFILAIAYTDTIMIGIFIDTTEAGIYTVASRIAGLLIFVLIAVNSILSPLVAEAHAKGEKENFQYTVTLATNWIFCGTVLIGFILIFLGKFFLGLFGEGFDAGYPLLLILLCGQFICAFCGPVGVVLNMTGNQNTTAFGMGIGAAVNVILNFILIPKMGAIGAAYATAISIAVWNIILALAVWKKLGVICIPWILHKH